MEKKINEKKSLLREAEKMNGEGSAKPKRERRSRRHGGGIFGAILTKLIIILFLIIVLLGGGYYITRNKFTPKTEVNISVVMNQLTFCQELVTAKYQYSDIIAINKSTFFAKSFSIIKYSGVIRIGIEDIKQSDIDIYKDGKAVRIKLPDVEVLGNDITGQEVFDESHSIFIPITTGEIFAEIEGAKEKTLEELIDDGILDEAREQAKKVIQQMMLAAGFEEVIVN